MSDDTQEFKDAQRRHGEKIRAERAIMDMAGVSRSQARAALRGVAAFQRQITAGRDAAPTQPDVQRPPPTMQITEVTQSAPKLTPPTRAGGGGGPSGVGGGGALGPIVLTLSKNGLPQDYNINAEEA